MKTLLLAAFAAVALAPVAMAAPAPVQAAAAAKFTLDTPIESIVANEKAKAALDASLPGITTHESYEMFKGMSLKQLSGYAPEQLTAEVLEKVEKALAAVE